MINNSYHWVTGLKRDGYKINRDPEKAHKYKTRSNFSKHVKKYGLNVLQVGQRPKYYVKANKEIGNVYLLSETGDSTFHTHPTTWVEEKCRATKYSKTRAMNLAARAEGTIVLCS